MLVGIPRNVSSDSLVRQTMPIENVVRGEALRGWTMPTFDDTSPLLVRRGQHLSGWHDDDNVRGRSDSSPNPRDRQLLRQVPRMWVSGNRGSACHDPRQFDRVLQGGCDLQFPLWMVGARRSHSHDRRSAGDTRGTPVNLLPKARPRGTCSRRTVGRVSSSGVI